MISLTTSTAQSLDIQSPVKILALGDSYTIGQSVPAAMRWPVQLADSLEVRGYVIDTVRIIATTGWRTDNLIQAIKNQNLENQNYNLVSLLIGVNNQYQNRPFSQYITEFPALVDSAIRYAGGNPSRVFIVSIPDYAYTPFGQGSSNPQAISDALDQYNAYNHHVADSLGIKWFDITPISRMGLERPELVANDNLHPSGTQYTEWVELMLDFIDNQTVSTKPVASKKKLNTEVYPNPASTDIELHLPHAEAAGVRIQLHQLNGQVVISDVIYQHRYVMHVADFDPGLYFLHIESSESDEWVKVVIVK